MNRNVEHFLFVCRCLSNDKSQPALSALRDDIGASDVDWQEVVEIANRHFVTPALWVALREKGLVPHLPDELREFLNEIHRLNVVRNEKLREEALIVTAGLNDAAIVPAILKGGVHLFEHAFDDPGTRMMRDLDFLVPMDRFDDSVAVLGSLGFKTEQSSNEWMRAHSSPPLWRPGGAASIDLHKDIGDQTHVLKAEVALQEAVAVDPDGLKLMALSPTHQVIHNFFHGQIEDRFHELGFVSLKQLHDLLSIWQRHGDAIDWKAIRGVLERQSLSSPLASYVHQAEHLLNLPRQAEIPRTLRARLHFRRCLAQIRWNGLMSFFSFWGAATSALKWSRINYMYRCRNKRYLVNFFRIRHLCIFLMKFDWGIGAKAKHIQIKRAERYDFN